MAKDIFRILLIDDDLNINHINKRLLELNNFGDEIISCLTGHEALYFLENCLPNDEAIPSLILLDIMMPVMNGFEFLEAFELLDPLIKCRCKIIVVSSTELEADIARVKTNPHVVEFFSKPISVADITFLKTFFSQ